MIAIEKSSLKRKRFIISCLSMFFILTACDNVNSPGNDIGVSIHGVNYSEQDFSYFLEDPKDKSNSGGGETIGRYEAGGTMCCYSLPKKWYSGLKVKVDTIYWLAKKPDGTLPEMHDSQMVDVPEYSHPGEVWVLREANGTSALVVSDLQPNHVDWPGKIKGWPIPSLTYKRERWTLEVKDKEGIVEFYEGLLRDLEEDPQKSANEAWIFTITNDPKSLVNFKGPHDKKFLNSLRVGYEKSLEVAKERVKIYGEKP